MSTKNWTEEEIEHMREGYASGVPLKVLCKQLGCSIGTLSRAASAMGLTYNYDLNQTAWFKAQDDAFQRAMTKAIGDKLERAKAGVKGVPPGDFNPQRFSPESEGESALQTNWNF